MIWLLACAPTAVDTTRCTCADTADHVHEVAPDSALDSDPPAGDDTASGVPTAALAADATEGTLPLTVHFDPVGSAAPAGLDSVQFDYGDGHTGTDTEHTYWSSGTFTARIVVADVTGCRRPRRSASRSPPCPARPPERPRSRARSPTRT